VAAFDARGNPNSHGGQRAIEPWGRASIAYPRDLLARQYAHVGEFFLAYSQMLR
jgi:hypothetical protein